MAQPQSPGLAMGSSAGPPPRALQHPPLPPRAPAGSRCAGELMVSSCSDEFCTACVALRRHKALHIFSPLFLTPPEPYCWQAEDACLPRDQQLGCKAGTLLLWEIILHPWGGDAETWSSQACRQPPASVRPLRRAAGGQERGASEGSVLPPAPLLSPLQHGGLPSGERGPLSSVCHGQGCRGRGRVLSCTASDGNTHFSHSKSGIASDKTLPFTQFLPNQSGETS